MTRNQLWIKENDILDNYDRIKLLFQSFDLQEDKDFKLDYDNAIRFIRWQNGYEQVFRIVVDENICGLILFMRSIKNNRGMNEKYHIYRRKDGTPLIFEGNDCWFDLIKFLRR